jgi:hypothetical protein
MRFTRRTTAFVVERIDGFARTTILAWRRTAWHILIFAILASITRVAVTSGK